MGASQGSSSKQLGVKDETSQESQSGEGTGPGRRQSREGEWHQASRNGLGNTPSPCPAGLAAVIHPDPVAALPRVSLSLWLNTQAQRLGTGRAGKKARGVESDFLGEEVVLLLV